jgi:DNA polymerase delta subunit 4
MAPQRSSSAKAHSPKTSGSLRQGTLSFASAKRSGSTTGKDSLKGKTVATSAEPAKVTPIRVGRKRKYEPDAEPEHEQATETTDALERETLDTEDRRWNKAYGLAREKMGNIQPSLSLRRSSPCCYSLIGSVPMA